MQENTSSLDSRLLIVIQCMEGTLCLQQLWISAFVSHYHTWLLVWGLMEEPMSSFSMTDPDILAYCSLWQLNCGDNGRYTRLRILHEKWEKENKIKFAKSAKLDWQNFYYNVKASPKIYNARMTQRKKTIRSISWFLYIFPCSMPAYDQLFYDNSSMIMSNLTNISI